MWSLNLITFTHFDHFRAPTGYLQPSVAGVRRSSIALPVVTHMTQLFGLSCTLIDLLVLSRAVAKAVLTSSSENLCVTRHRDSSA